MEAGIPDRDRRRKRRRRRRRRRRQGTQTTVASTQGRRTLKHAALDVVLRSHDHVEVTVEPSYSINAAVVYLGGWMLVLMC